MVKFILKGVLEIKQGGIIVNLKTIPFREFQFKLVPLIPYSEIAKTIPYFSYFYPCFSPLIKTKRTLRGILRIVLNFKILKF